MSIDLIDLTTWRSAHPHERQQVIDTLDTSLRKTGFVLVTGHGVSTTLRQAVRDAARTFFDLPPGVKDRYRNERGIGWTGRHAVSVGAIANPTSPPDLVEIWTARAHHHQRWPREAPELQGSVEMYLREMRRLSRELLGLFADALGQPSDFLTRYDPDAAWTCNINWYPSRGQSGTPRPGQYRMGAHQDWNLMTVLDRQAAMGGLQICTNPENSADPRTGWEDAPQHPDALTINLGELGAMYSGERWKAGWHRVLPPHEGAPEQTSLVYFYMPQPGAPLPPSPHRDTGNATTAGEFNTRRLEAIYEN